MSTLIRFSLILSLFCAMLEASSAPVKASDLYNTYAGRRAVREAEREEYGSSYYAARTSVQAAERHDDQPWFGARLWHSLVAFVESWGSVAPVDASRTWHSPFRRF